MYHVRTSFNLVRSGWNFYHTYFQSILQRYNWSFSFLTFPFGFIRFWKPGQQFFKELSHISLIKQAQNYLWVGSCWHTFFWTWGREKWEICARTRPDLDPVVFSTNIQHPVCTWTYRDHDLTNYNWLSREKNRYTIISCCLFLSINTPKIKSCRLVEKRRTNVLYVDFSSTVFRF